MGDRITEAPITKRPAFRLATALAIVLFAVLYLVIYEIGRTTSESMLSLREVSFNAMLAGRVDGEGEKFLEGIQPENRSERAFRVNLKFPRIPKDGDHVVAERAVNINDIDKKICIKGYIHNDYFRPESRVAIETFKAWIQIGERRSSQVSLASTKNPVLVEAGPVEVKDGSIDIGLHLKAFHDQSQESWQRVSLTSFEYVFLDKCGVESQMEAADAD